MTKKNVYKVSKLIHYRTEGNSYREPSTWFSYQNQTGTGDLMPTFKCDIQIHWPRKVTKSSQLPKGNDYVLIPESLSSYGTPMEKTFVKMLEWLPNYLRGENLD